MMNKWIKIEDDLPEIEENYSDMMLVTIKDFWWDPDEEKNNPRYDVQVAQLHHEGSWIGYDGRTVSCYDRKVIAWMAMIEPYIP